jgi:hypothetical protein
MRIQALALGTLLLAVSPVVPLPGAEDTTRRRQVLSLLETCWETGEAAEAIANEKRAALARQGAFDGRASYAWGLVLLRQRRYEEALAAFDQAALGEQERVAALRARAWVALLLKNYGVALTTAERLGDTLGGATTEGDKNPEEADDAARFLGSVFGYLEGPLGDVPAAGSQAATEQRVLARLSDSQRAVFDEAKQAVLEKFASLATEQADTREQALADAEAEKQQTLADIEQRRTKMAAAAQDLQERRVQLQSELNDTLTEIGRADRPLLAELNRLEARAAQVEGDLALLSTDLLRLESLLVREEDPLRRDDLRREIDRVSVLANRRDADLSFLQRQAGGIQSQRGELAARQVKAQRDFGGQVQSIDRQFQAMRGEERKLAGAEKKATKPSTGRSVKSNAIGASAKAFKTYEPFLIEQERERLLAALR